MSPNPHLILRNKATPGSPEEISTQYLLEVSVAAAALNRSRAARTIAKPFKSKKDEVRYRRASLIGGVLGAHLLGLKHVSIGMALGYFGESAIEEVEYMVSSGRTSEHMWRDHEARLAEIRKIGDDL